ncbi:Mpo1-like protein [Pseudoalteromonas mariniglutinosa]|uniref:Mpo1-like protein n=1 Tax=Pseudoalteromonas mariniglutinosa TaxID=206042 RepID=UPI00384CF8A4
MAIKEQQHFASFKEFYPYYLQEHKNSTCRRLHLIGSLLVISIFITALATTNYVWLWLLPIAGYGFAWVGHFFFEKNRPATFKHPFYSFIADWVMLKDMLTGKVPI